ncbi:hypothetical protein B447_04978 [Thauera sp. 27]|uniref:hypothetical protein n=1 Tax=Thauera sp. 27 TaxID=305700 RepID=UPI0002D0AA7E|nr:hypothetical protein [Thauera sp. 27]ENO82063.1 hypothetical protein B447_04978 [Thauera sp. 27]
MPESDINVVITRLGLLSDDVGELKETLRQIASAVTRLALVEERQSQTNEALGRAFKQIDKIDGKLTSIEQRVAAIEKEMPGQRQTSSWVVAFVLASAATAFMFIAHKAGLK